MTGIVIPDGGTIGSASDTDALTITNTGVVKASQSIATGTIKDATGANNSISIATNGKPTFSAGIANTGTIDAGTLGSSVVVPASIGGSMVLLSSGSASDSSSIEFSGINNYSGYSKLVFIIDKIVPASDDVSFQARIAFSGTSFKDASYKTFNHRFSTNGSVTGDSGYSSASGVMINNHGVNGGTGNPHGISGTITLHNAWHTSQEKYMQNDLVFMDNSGYILTSIGAGTYEGSDQTDGITAVSFGFYGSGYIHTGNIYMFGIKNA